MSLDNAVPIEVHDWIVRDYNEALSNIKQVEIDLKKAIAQGDLSENTTYDNLKIDRATLRSQILDAESFFKNCEVLNQEEIHERYPLLFSNVEVNIIDISNDTETRCTIVPTSNIEVGILNAVRSVDPIGRAILDAGENEKRIILKRENIIIEIISITHYKEGNLVISLA